MQAYTGFAAVYDTFMDNIPYEEWCEYLTGLLKEQGSFRRTAPGSRLRDWKSHGASGKVRLRYDRSR